MEFKDYYKVLGVADDADDKTIKTAYRKLARQYHPDVSTEHQAEERFKEVTEAYEVLHDTTKRAEYDELRRYGERGQFQPPPDWQSKTGGFSGGEQVYEGDFSEFFNSIFGAAGARGRDFGGGEGFGARQSSGRRGQDIETEMPIFLEDTLSDEQKTIEYNMPQVDAQGLRQSVRKTLKVKIPTGVSDGDRIRLKSQGSPGIGSGEPGDLYLVIKLVPHPLFDVEGHNLIVTVPVAPWEAALGAKITVPTLDGDIRLTLPENSQAGRRMRVKGRGLVGKNGRGDLFAVVKVVMPPTLDERSKNHWQSLADEAAFDPRAQWGNK